MSMVSTTALDLEKIVGAVDFERNIRTVVLVGRATACVELDGGS